MLHVHGLTGLNMTVWMLAAFFSLGATAQETTPRVLGDDCTFKVVKTSKAEKVHLSRWGSAAGTPFGGMWKTNLEGPSQEGQVWVILSGKLDCRPGFPLEGTKLADDSSGVFPVVAYSGTCAEIEKEEFNVIEGSPGTGRMGADGKPVWGVLPSSKTGARTLYLSDHLYESGPPDIGLCLVFAVPRLAKKLNLHIGDRPPSAVDVGK